MTFPAVIRPGGPIVPRPITSGVPDAYHLQFLTAEERATAVLMQFFRDARLELETFIREGSLTASDALFYRQLLDATNRIGSKLNADGAKWVSSVIPEAFSAGHLTHSSIVVPQAALEALSRETLSLIRDTTAEMRQSIRGVIAQGILQSLPADAVRQRLLASGLTNIPHWPSVEYRAGVIARTETMRAYNAGALSGILDNGAYVAEWIASPDEATCHICLPRDGKRFLIADPPPGATYGLDLPRLPRIPAHPRCRCTIRAIYRDDDGNVLRQGVVGEPPELPADAMGGTDPPIVPPAVGDWTKAVGSLNDRRLIEALQLEHVPALPGDTSSVIFLSKQLLAERRVFWRSIGALDDEQIRILTTGTKKLVAERMDAFLRLRYGIGYVDKAGMTAELRAVTIRALELIRSITPQHVVDNPYLKIIGDKPYGAKRFGSNTLARAFLSGHVEWNPKLSKEFVGKFLRIHNDGAFEVFIHELMHTTHYQLGAYAEREVARSGAFEFVEAQARNAEWRAVRSKSTGLSPSKGAIEALDKQIAEFERALERYPETYSSSRNASVIASLRRQRDALAAAMPGPEHWPTEYARENALEDFAESATMYLLDPARLKKWSPARYEYLRTHVFGGLAG